MVIQKSRARVDDSGCGRRRLRSAASKASKNSLSSHRLLRFESLEQRLVLAPVAGLFEHQTLAPPSSGSLQTLAVVADASTINAGPGSNVIVLRAAENDVDVEISIDGVLTNTYPLLNSAPLTINGQGGNDVLVLDYGNEHPFPVSGFTYNGGNQPEDFVMVANGSLLRIAQVISDPHTGSTQLSRLRCTGFGTLAVGPLAVGGCFESRRTMNYTGVAASIFTASASIVSFELPSGPNRNVTIGDDILGIPGFSQFQGATVGNVYYKNPSSVTYVALGDHGDSITVLPPDPEPNAQFGVEIDGGVGADLINGSSLAETFDGGGGNDVIHANGGNDILTGGPGNDLLFGGLGDDTYELNADSPAGTDTLTEPVGGGIDTVSFATTTLQSVAFSLANAALQTVNANLAVDLNSASTFENIKGGTRNDLLIGNALANVISDFLGNDRIIGGGGNDRLEGGDGKDTYVFDTDVSLGTDTIVEFFGIDTLDFSPTTTRSVAINLSLATTQIVNAGLSLILSPGQPIENVNGGSQGDTIIGNAAANTLSGNGGNDSLQGGAGNDSLAGGPGNDTYVFDTDLALGIDNLIEAAGAEIDTLDFSLTTTRSIAVNLGNQLLQVVNAGLSIDLNSDRTFENVIGGSRGDVIIGNLLNNTLRGGAGRDVMISGAGADKVFGEGGEDLLIAGTTSHDNNVVALQVILTEWTNTTKTYLTRTANLRAGIGGVQLKASGVGATVTTDPTHLVNLTGGADRDWFFAAAGDVLSGLIASEAIDVLP